MQKLGPLSTRALRAERPPDLMDAWELPGAEEEKERSRSRHRLWAL